MRADARKTERVALAVFIAYVVVAIPVLLWIGSYRWFFGDEWAFLSGRSVTLDGLFRPHNGQHWVTIPVLAYRGMYSLIGLRAYWPYQLLVIVLHLTLAALLLVVMRRAGVGPWMATIVAGLFVLLGAAEDNILWAFQIGFVGALVGGITQIILADHDGPIDRRDWIGLGAGLVALMMSGQAPPLILGAGLVCVFHRRWAAAVLHTVPLGAVYLLWARIEDLQPVLHGDGRSFTLLDYLRWMNSAASGLFTALGHFAPVAVVLAGLFVAGIALGWRNERSAFIRRAAVPLALVVAAFVSMSVAAPSRFFSGPEAARAGRYIGVMAALTLPALGVALDAITRRWPRATPAVLVMLLIPLPFNAFGFRADPILTAGYYESERANVTSLPDDPLATRVPPWVRPNETLLGQPDMTIGWLIGARAENKLPTSAGLTPVARQLLPLQLGVARTEDEPPPTTECMTFDEPLPMAPQLGDRWVFGTPVAVAGRLGDRPATLPIVLEAGVIEITLPDLQLLLSPVPGDDHFVLCR